MGRGLQDERGSHEPGAGPFENTVSRWPSRGLEGSRMGGVSVPTAWGRSPEGSTAPDSQEGRREPAYLPQQRV